MRATDLRSAWVKQSRHLLECWPIAVPGLIGFLVAMAIAWTRWPVPSMHDDFGNLLVASTLLEGRLTNPVPSAWQSMETFHIVLQPTYATKFPIGLGAMLAVGKLLTGSFAVGLWLSAALACSAISWMITAHFPRRWGFAAGVFAATHPCWQNGWSQEFTNGWLAIAGVALVFGGLLRIRRSYRSESSTGTRTFAGSLTAVVGAGCVLTLFSRPFEGGLVCGLLGLYFLRTLIARRLTLSSRFWRAALPGAAVLACGLCLQLVINHSITGDYLQLPYQLHEKQYGVAPVLIWQKPHEPSMGHRFLEQVKFHRGWSMEEFQKAASFQGYFTLLQTRVGYSINHWGNFLALAPVCLLALGAERRRLIGFIGLLLIAFLIINCIPWAMPQYVSPLIPVVLFIACAVARGIFQRLVHQFSLSAHRLRIEALLLVCILLFHGCSTCRTAYDRSHFRSGWEKTVADQRAAMVYELESLPGNDLVLVKYQPNHNVHFEWVFNEANLERSSVIWARWGSAEMNDNVLKSYAGRKNWLLEFDQDGKPLLGPAFISEITITATK